jgi:OHCU decarboxylase
VSLAELNALGREEFVERLGGVAEGSPWVAERAWAEGPFADVDALADAFRRAINSASKEWQLGLIRAHPDLAGRFALSPESASEQSSAGLDRLTSEQLAEFTRLNEAYRERYGFPFVICAREHDARSILTAYRERIGHEGIEEQRTALAEIGKIVRLRLADYIDSPAAEAGAS